MYLLPVVFLSDISGCRCSRRRTVTDCLDVDLGYWLVHEYPIPWDLLANIVVFGVGFAVKVERERHIGTGTDESGIKMIFEDTTASLSF